MAIGLRSGHLTKDGRDQPCAKFSNGSGPRILSVHGGIQVNFCKNPYCENYGTPDVQSTEPGAPRDRYVVADTPACVWPATTQPSGRIARTPSHAPTARSTAPWRPATRTQSPDPMSRSSRNFDEPRSATDRHAGPRRIHPLRPLLPIAGSKQRGNNPTVPRSGIRYARRGPGAGRLRQARG